MERNEGLESGLSPALGGLGYLFERFPSFTQTFCAREVSAMGGLGFSGPVFSIRNLRSDEPEQNFPDLQPVTYLPDRFDEILASDAHFRRKARKGLEKLRQLWDGEGQKRRIYESLWLQRHCSDLQVRHLHVHFAGLAARAAFWLHRSGGPSYSLTAHANDIFCDEPPGRLKHILGAARCIVTVSDFSVRHLSTVFPDLAPKIHRVYNGIDLSRFHHSTFPGGRPLVLTVGRSIEKKGFPDLIDACALLGDIDFECQIVGGGPLDDSLKSRIAGANLQDKVFVCGPKPEAEISALLARARAFVLPCVRTPEGSMDNLPTVIMEAMAAGLPVISTPLGGIPEMVDDGKTGYLVPERNPEALAGKIKSLLQDPECAQTLGAKGLEKCRHQFAIGVTSRSLVQIWARHQICRPLLDPPD